MELTLQALKGSTEKIYLFSPQFTCMVRELTSSAQAIVWGLVVVERQVFTDQALRPFSAIFAWNLKRVKVDVGRKDLNLETGSTSRPDHLCICVFYLSLSVSFDLSLMSNDNKWWPKMKKIRNLETGSTRSPDHLWAISKWRLVESVAPSKAPASTKNPNMGSVCKLASSVYRHVWILTWWSQKSDRQIWCYLWNLSTSLLLLVEKCLVKGASLSVPPPTRCIVRRCEAGIEDYGRSNLVWCLSTCILLHLVGGWGRVTWSPPPALDHPTIGFSLLQLWKKTREWRGLSHMYEQDTQKITNLLHTVQPRSYRQGEGMIVPVEGLMIKSNSFLQWNGKIYLSDSVFPCNMSQVSFGHFAPAVFINIPGNQKSCINIQRITTLTQRQSYVDVPLDILAPLPSPRKAPST